MSRLPYRVPSLRGANMLRADPERIENADKSRWATGRNVKAETGEPHRYTAVKKWMLKRRDAMMRAEIVGVVYDRSDAEKWVDGTLLCGDVRGPYKCTRPFAHEGAHGNEFQGWD